MHRPIRVADDIFWVGVNDRETHLFEELWSLPRGLSYNSYIIDDEKVALIDTVRGSFFSEYIDKIRRLIGEDRSVDYLIVNHMEPDHSGAIKALRQVFPDMKVVGNSKTLEYLREYYGVVDKTLQVENHDVLDLGRHKLVFAFVPMVHWPETMVTYESIERVLFSCDAFGSFGSLDGGIFDDQMDMTYFENETLRYFANIVGRFSSFVQKAVCQVRQLDISTICPSHGPILRSDPWHMVDLYDRWSRQETEEGALIVYGSMYGNTAKLADSIARGMKNGGLRRVMVHSIATADLSEMIRDAWRYRGLVLASCSYNMGIFPRMGYFMEMLANKRFSGRYLGICGSYTWSRGAAMKHLRRFAEEQNWNLVDPQVEIRGSAKSLDLDECIRLGENMAASIMDGA